MPQPMTPADGLAWITGASSGIGLAVAIELARRGWRVAITARRGDELDIIASEQAQGGVAGQILAFPGDITDRAGMAALVARIEAEAGPIALAFLNAGAFFLDDATVGGDGFRKTFDLNVIGTANCLEPLVTAMRGRGKGQIALNASIAGYGGLPRDPAYCASKSALIVLAEALATPLAREGLLMQVVCPGFVRTPLTDRNTTRMPFLMEVDEAAARICDGFSGGAFEIAFPRRMAWLAKAINMLPYRAYFAVTGKAAAKR